MSDFKILMSVTLLLLLQGCKMVASRPSGSAEGTENYGFSKDYYALQKIIGDHLGGTSTEKSKVIELLLQLLEEIDLPTLCEVIVNDTKANHNAFLRVPIKYTNIDDDLLYSLDSPITLETPNNEGTLHPPSKMAVDADRTTSAESLEQTAVKSNEEEIRVRQDGAEDNNPTPATYKYHTYGLNNGDQISSQERQYAKDGSLNNVNYPKVLPSSVLSPGKENPSNDLPPTYVVHNEQTVYSSLLKDKTASLNEDGNPVAAIGDLKQMYLTAHHKNSGEVNGALSGYADDINNKNILVKQIDVERPREQLFSQSLVLGDWMNKNKFDRNFLTTYTDNDAEVKVMGMPRYENNMVSSDRWSDNVKSDYKTKFNPTKQQQQKYAREYLGSQDIVGQMLSPESSTPSSTLFTYDPKDSVYSITPLENQRQVDYLEELGSTLMVQKPNNIPIIAKDTETSHKDDVASMAMFPQTKTKSVEYENEITDNDSNEADKRQQIKMHADYSITQEFIDNNNMNTIDNKFAQEKANWIDASHFIAESRPTDKSEELPSEEQGVTVDVKTQTSPQSYINVTPTSYLYTQPQVQLLLSEIDNKTAVTSTDQLLHNPNEIVTQATAVFSTTLDSEILTGNNEMTQTTNIVQEQTATETFKQSSRTEFQQHTPASNLPQWAQSFNTDLSETARSQNPDTLSGERETSTLNDSVLSNEQEKGSNSTAFLDSQTAPNNVTFTENGIVNISTTMDYPQNYQNNVTFTENGIVNISTTMDYPQNFQNKVTFTENGIVNMSTTMDYPQNSQNNVTFTENGIVNISTTMDYPQNFQNNVTFTENGIVNMFTTTDYLQTSQNNVTDTENEIGNRFTTTDYPQTSQNNVTDTENEIGNRFTTTDYPQTSQNNVTDTENEIGHMFTTTDYPQMEAHVKVAKPSAIGVSFAEKINATESRMAGDNSVTQTLIANNGLIDTGVHHSEVTHAGVTINNVPQAGVSNGDVTEAEVTNSEVTQAGVTNNEVNQAGVTHNEVTQAGVTHNEVNQAGVTNSEVSQAGVTNSEVSRAGVTNSEVTQAGVTNSEVTQAGVINSEVTQAGVTNNDATHDGVTNSEVTQTGITNSEVTQAGVTNSEVTQAGVTNGEVTQAGVTNSEVTQAGVTNSEVTQAGVTNSEVTQAGVTNGEVTQAGVTNEVSLAEVTNSEVSQAIVTNSEVSQAGVTNSEVSQAGVTNSEVTQAGITNNEVTQAGVTNSEVTQTEVINNVTQTEVTDSDVTQTGVANGDITQISISSNGVTQTGVTNSEVTQTGVINSEVTQAGVINSEVTQAGVKNNEVTQAGVINSEVTQAVLTNNEVTQTGVINSEVTQAGVTNNEVTQDGVSINELMQARVVNNNVTQAEVSYNEVTQVRVAHIDAINANVTNNVTYAEITHNVTYAEITNNNTYAEVTNNITYAEVTNTNVPHDEVSNNHTTSMDTPIIVTQQSSELDTTDHIRHTTRVTTSQADDLLFTETNNSTISFSMNSTNDTLFENISTNNVAASTTDDVSLHTTDSNVQEESALHGKEVQNKTMSIVNDKEIVSDMSNNITSDMGTVNFNMSNKTSVMLSAYSSILVEEASHNKSNVSAETTEFGIEGDVNSVNTTADHKTDKLVTLNLITESGFNTTADHKLVTLNMITESGFNTTADHKLVTLNLITESGFNTTADHKLVTLNMITESGFNTTSTMEDYTSTAPVVTSLFSNSQAPVIRSPVSKITEPELRSYLPVAEINASGMVDMSNSELSSQNVTHSSIENDTYVQILNETLGNANTTVEVANTTSLFSTALNLELSASMQTDGTGLNGNMTAATEQMAVDPTVDNIYVAPKFVLEKTADFDHFIQPSVIDNGSNRMHGSTLDISIKLQPSEKRSEESTSSQSLLAAQNDTQISGGKMSDSEGKGIYNFADTENATGSTSQSTISFFAASVKESDAKHANVDAIQSVTMGTTVNRGAISQVLRANTTTNNLKIISSKIAETKSNLSRINMNLLKPLRFRIQYEDNPSETPSTTETISKSSPSVKSEVSEQQTAFTSESTNMISLDVDNSTKVANVSTSTVNAIKYTITESTTSIPTITTASSNSEVITPASKSSVSSAEVISSTVTVPSNGINQSPVTSSTGSSYKPDDLKDFTQTMFNGYSGTFEFSNIPNSDSLSGNDKTQFGRTSMLNSGNWAKVYNSPNLPLYGKYHNKPSNRPYMSQFSDHVEQVKPRTKLVLDSWKAYNIAVGKSKTKANNEDIINQRGAPEIHLYSNYRYTPAPADNLRSYLWQARPWPKNAIYNLGQGETYNSMMAGKPELYRNQNIDMSKSVNYQTKTLNKIDSSHGQVKTMRNANTWGDRFSQGYYGRVFDDESNGLNTVDTTTWPTLQSHDMVNFDMFGDNLKYLKGHDQVQGIKHKYSNLNGNLGMKASHSFDLNQRYRNLMKNFPLYHNPELDQRKHNNMQHGVADAQPEYSATWKDDSPRTEGQFEASTVPETEVTSSWRTTDTPTHYNGVPAPEDYTCPGLFGYHKDPKNCQAFFICSWGMAHRVVCPPGTLYNSKEAVCDWAVNIRCTVTPGQ